MGEILAMLVLKWGFFWCEFIFPILRSWGYRGGIYKSGF